MPDINGLTGTSREKMIVKVGALYIHNTQHGVLETGPSFDLGVAMTNLTYAGKSNKVAGLDRVELYDPKLTVTFKEISDTLLALLMPGSTTIVAGGVTTRIPPTAGLFLTPVNNVRAIYTLGNDTFYEQRLIRAMPIRGPVNGAYPQAGGFAVTFEGRSGEDAPDAPSGIELFYPTIPVLA